jgi:beta-barrel assembly-enhancing protease
MHKPFLFASLFVFAASAHAQSGLTRTLNNAGKKLEKIDATIGEYTFTDAEEEQMGSDISGMLRQKYGVVQDRAAHRYVTLVGTLLGQASTRPNLKWTFIILDTDGINAFAAPGGFIHITRGALALIQNEAELADVLGHEIGHVTAKHTLKAIQKAKLADAGAKATRRDFLSEVANAAYSMILENSFDRGDEMESDKVGVTLANSVGYAPTGLSAFLTRLADRYKDAKERSGVFASHPETKARIDGIASAITTNRLNAAATVTPRYAESIKFTLLAVADVPVGAPPAPPAKSSSGSSGKIGLGNLTSIGREKSGSQTTASAGSRGVNTDRDAKGGPNKAAIVVTVTPAEVLAFKQGIS